MTKKIHYELYLPDIANYMGEEVSSPYHPVTTLEVPVSDSIFNEMIECLYDFESEWQKKPGAFLLSPVAFLQFKYEVERSPWTRIEPPCAAKFEGIPVFCADISYRVLPILPECLIAGYEWKRQQNQRGYQ